MARSRHIGKLLVDFSCDEVEVRENPAAGPTIRPDGCYIVTGGTSGFGLTTARWLAEQRAGKIILASRSGRNAPGIEATIQFIESQGTQVEVLSVDVTDAAQVHAMVECAGSFFLRGIVHGAMVLDDAMMADLSEERFRRVLLPKVVGALNLAEVVQSASHLDFLVFYSSISALIGNKGQTNYVAANSLLDGLAHSLRARGIPALSINWGALAESGIVARDDRLGSVLASAGITGLGDHEALGVLEKMLRISKPQLGSFNVDWEKWHHANPKLADDPRFRELWIASRENDGSDVASQVRQALAGSSREQRLHALGCHLQEVLAATLKMSKENVSTTRKLNEMGVDSLMVLELGLGIKERLGIGFSVIELLKGQNLQQLAALAENRLWSSQQANIMITNKKKD
jgi:NAD(P)-dependent dehydrogenase (short-subunit alcohol dehydrogenase family)/acyl carrier protein